MKKASWKTQNFSSATGVASFSYFTGDCSDSSNHIISLDKQVNSNLFYKFWLDQFSCSKCFG
jgi:hypothetical protein